MLEINKFDKIIVANWKLQGSLDFIKHYFNDLDFHEINSKVCGIICPPSIYLKDCFSFSPQLFLGAQDCSNFNKGAYTGEVSAFMLKENNCQFCIIGHSERRSMFGQTSEDIRIKAENLINQNINPIICIGENLDEKNNGITKDILREQILESLPLNSSINSVIIAYEPIWAIGSGLIPTLDEINDIHYFLKKEIVNFENYKIIYGGSVKSDNAKNIMDLDYVDGVLVGGASLNSLEFKKILKYSN